jgi:hypothetical protein
MVWVPSRGQRAGVRARFAELTRESQGGAVPSSEAVAGAVLESLSASSTTCQGSASCASDHKGVQKATSTLPKGRALQPTKAIKKQQTSSNPGARLTIHHIPPKNPKPYILKRVKEHHHRAYHTIFGSSGSLEECIRILQTHWWPDNPAD